MDVLAENTCWLGATPAELLRAVAIVTEPLSGADDSCRFVTTSADTPGCWGAGPTPDAAVADYLDVLGEWTRLD